MRDLFDRERLAEHSARKHAAAHKGRPHFHAHQSRAMRTKKIMAAREAEAKRVKHWRRFKDQVRAYWRGEGDHP